MSFMGLLHEERAFRAVLFDIDGTLVDTIPMIVAGLGDAFEHFGGFRPSESELKSLIGTPLSVQMEAFGLDKNSTQLDERVQYTIERYKDHADLIRRLPAVESAYQALADAGIPTALVTSRNRAELEWFLGAFPMFTASKVAVCASDVSQPKPDAEPALLACSLLGLASDEVCFIGDATHDVECARAAEIYSVAVAYGGSNPSDLSHTHPDVLLYTPEELQAWIRQTILKRTTCFSTTQNESKPQPAA